MSIVSSVFHFLRHVVGTWTLYCIILYLITHKDKQIVWWRTTPFKRGANLVMVSEELGSKEMGRYPYFLSQWLWICNPCFQSWRQPLDVLLWPINVTGNGGLRYLLWIVLDISLFSRMSSLRLSRHSLLSFCCWEFSSWSCTIRSCSLPKEWLEKTKVPERSLGISPNTIYSICKDKMNQNQSKIDKDSS